MAKKPHTPARRNRTSIAPKKLPRVTLVKSKTKTAVRRAAQKAKDVAHEDVQLTHVGAGLAGLGGSVYTSSFIVERDWLSPEWTAVVLSLAGVAGTAAAYHYDLPHLYWGGLGWTFGSAGHGWMAAHVDRKYQKQLKQLEARTGAKRNAALLSAETQRNTALAPADDIDHPGHGSDMSDADYIRLAEERNRELEAEVAAARARMSPEIELVAA